MWQEHERRLLPGPHSVPTLLETRAMLVWEEAIVQAPLKDISPRGSHAAETPKEGVHVSYYFRVDMIPVLRHPVFERLSGPRV